MSDVGVARSWWRICWPPNPGRSWLRQGERVALEACVFEHADLSSEIWIFSGAGKRRRALGGPNPQGIAARLIPSEARKGLGSVTTAGSCCDRFRQTPRSRDRHAAGGL